MSSEPSFRVALSKEAFKYYSKVSVTTARRLDRCFAALESDPTKGANIRPLQEMAGRYRYRIGGLRIVYSLDLTERVVYVLAILPRGQAYRQ